MKSSTENHKVRQSLGYGVLQANQPLEENYCPCTECAERSTVKRLV